MHLVYMTMIVIEASAGHNCSNMLSYPLIGIWSIASVSRNRIRNIRAYVAQTNTMSNSLK